MVPRTNDSATLNYVPYRDDIETIADDEAETQAKIVEVMTKGQHTNRARLVAYTTLANLRRHESNRTQAEPTSIDQVPT